MFLCSYLKLVIYLPDLKQDKELIDAILKEF